MPLGKNYKNGSSTSSTPTPPMSDNPVNLTIKKNPDLDMDLEVDLDQDIGHDQSMYIAQAASQLGKERHKNAVRVS